MAKKPRFGRLEITALNPFDPPLLETRPGWMEETRSIWPIGEDDLHFRVRKSVADGSFASTDGSLLSLDARCFDIRCDAGPAKIVKVLRALATLIERQGEELLSNEVPDVSNTLTVDETGNLHLPPIEYEDETTEAPEATAV